MTWAHDNANNEFYMIVLDRPTTDGGIAAAIIICFSDSKRLIFIILCVSKLYTQPQNNTIHHHIQYLNGTRLIQ
jgi:hypothetical protein